MPISWREDVSGWIRYNEDGSTSTVDAPLEDCFAFDVEVCVLEGHHPVIATALSKEAWYSWISPHLLNKTEPTRNCLTPSDLIKGNIIWEKFAYRRVFGSRNIKSTGTGIRYFTQSDCYKVI